MVQQLPIGPLKVQWSEDGLSVNTPTGHYQLDAQETFELFLYLYHHHVQENTTNGDMFDGMIGPTDSSPELPLWPGDKRGSR